MVLINPMQAAAALRDRTNFVDLSGVYEVPKLRGLKRGVYAAVAGPTYETPAETRREPAGRATAQARE